MGKRGLPSSPPAELEPELPPPDGDDMWIPRELAPATTKKKEKKKKKKKGEVVGKPLVKTIGKKSGSKSVKDMVEDLVSLDDPSPPPVEEEKEDEKDKKKEEKTSSLWGVLGGSKTSSKFGKADKPETVETQVQRKVRERCERKEREAQEKLERGAAAKEEEGYMHEPMSEISRVLCPHRSYHLSEGDGWKSCEQCQVMLREFAAQLEK
jgi:hypothetical protein